MEKQNAIIIFTKTIIERTQNIDDIVDSILDPFKDCIETFSDLSLTIKSIKSIISLNKKILLKSFIMNYSESLGSDFIVSEEETKKLCKYFENINNFHIISEIIDNALHSKSIKCSAILGTLAGKIIKNKKNVDNNDLIFIETLREINDSDLNNFIELYSNLKESYSEEQWNDKLFNKVEFRTRDLYKENRQHPLSDKNAIDFSIEKLKRTGIFSYGEGGIGSVGNSRGEFKITKVTCLFFILVNETKVFAYN